VSALHRAACLLAVVPVALAAEPVRTPMRPAVGSRGGSSGVSDLDRRAGLRHPNGGSLTTSVALRATPAVPEPATYGLLGAGLFALGGVVARRRWRVATA
jgi:hypothetical protein